MPAIDPGLRRVSVHSGTAAVDLCLPAGVAVAVLIPSIVDILVRDTGTELLAKRYHLSLPGGPTLNPSTTLQQNDISEGSVLILSHSPSPPPTRRYDDPAHAVRAALDAACPPRGQAGHRHLVRLIGAVAATCLTGVGGLALIRNALSGNGTRDLGATAAATVSAGVVALIAAVIAHRAYGDRIAGLALSVIATAFAAVAGFLAVPGAPDIPHVLLAATAATVTSVLAMRASGCGVVALTALSCVALFAAGAALVGVITAAPLHAIGSVSTLVSLGLLGAAARVSIVLAGLSPKLAPTADADDVVASTACLAAKAIRANDWLTGLLAAFSASACIGAIITVLAGAPRLSCSAFGALTGALLLLRSRSADRRRTLIFVVSGITITATTFGVSALRAPQHQPWIIAATAMLAAGSMYLGFVVPGLSFSPVVRRSADLAEGLALALMVPLTCWIAGIYGAVRELNLV